ncbi:hypothetical protein [Ralstonia pickettii]|uniref:hypothetical protein n=1 Tax=Ralstonia pickettii TaxID=329 RepID=UPI00117C2E23|nr:hypothetical protein [Ralstonia pickettii]
MTSAPETPENSSGATLTWLPDRFLACAEACERLAKLPQMSEKITAAALECSHACYLAAALRENDERQLAGLIFRVCMERCVALAVACALVTEAALCAALCLECEALCRERSRPAAR